MTFPLVVSRQEWVAARKEFLAKEKELTRQRDALNAARRRLPMVKIDKNYAFESPQGRVKLIDLFAGRRQLIVYHFMLDPRDPPPGKTDPYSEGCPGCSHLADNIPHLAHVHARDTTFVMVSRAPIQKIEPFKRRMGWTMPWVSSFDSDFNYDFHVTMDESVRPLEYNYRSKAELKARGQEFGDGELPGLSVFVRDGDQVYHTYSTYGRGLDIFLNTYNLLDHTPFGRQEGWEDSPSGWPQTTEFWLKHHDRYEADEPVSSCCSK